ncbi:MAG: hypothetical protein E7463_06720 [Ruminococcaceae bacterium]|nr:hypothetical protein [Oscillospiraceae bacterium]
MSFNWNPSPDNIWVAAHRGWSEKYPENTMEAYRAAAELGVDQIEIDVRITADGELVLIHDATVERTTNGKGKVCELTLEQLKSLDAGSWKGPEFAGAKIPTLVEFLEYLKAYPNMTVDFELKEYPVEGWEETAYSVCDRVMALIDAYGFTDRCVVNTFNATLHEYIQGKHGRKYRQHVYFPQSCMGVCAVDPYVYGDVCCMFNATRADFESMRKRGVKPWAGASVKDAQTVDNAIDCGAELITCNNPDVVLALLRERGKHA